jgi:hypothetical protein
MVMLILAFKQTEMTQSYSWVFLLNGEAIVWKSSKQDIVADSVIEAERESLDREFLDRDDVVPSISNPVDLYCDNTEAITQSKEIKSYQGSKHVMQ